MARGRPRSNFHDDDKLALRREKVRLNVQAHRQRQKEKKRLEALDQPSQPNLRWVSENERQASNSVKSCNPTGQPKFQQTCGKSSSEQPCSLLHEPSPEKQYTLSLLGIFRTRYLPERVTLPDKATKEWLTTPCALWIVKGYDLATMQENHVVTKIFRALGLAVMGHENQREDIRAVSLQTYHRTLAAISRQLSSLTKGENLRLSEYMALFISCHAAAIFQLNANGSMERMFEYVRGIGSVLVHRLLFSHSVPKDWEDLIKEYRLFEIVFCLIYRTPSILSGLRLHRRVSFEAHIVSRQDLKKSETSGLDALVLIAEQIPPIMCYLDDVQAAKTPFDRVSKEIDATLECLTRVMIELEQWSDNFLDQHGAAVVKSEPYIQGRGDMDFPGLEVASGWTFWLSFKVHAIETYISINEVAQSSQEDDKSSTSSDCEDGANEKGSGRHLNGIEDARAELRETIKLLVRSMPYLLEADIGFIGRSFVAFPLETVRVALLHELERELRVVHSASHSGRPESMGGRLQSIKETLTTCSVISGKAKALGCALFSDQWSPDSI